MLFESMKIFATAQKLNFCATAHVKIKSAKKDVQKIKLAQNLSELRYNILQKVIFVILLFTSSKENLSNDLMCKTYFN